MAFIAEILISALLVIAGLFGLIGAIGLVKLPDPMTRLHGPTKAATLGVGGVLIASFLWFAVFGDHVSVHELLITLFIFLTAPITGMMIAKAHIHRMWRKEDLPPPGNGEVWANFGDSGKQGAVEQAMPEKRAAVRAGDETAH
ncbi:MAG: Na+/H+ antiporter subunit G [Paracoccus sp. (in: a-proteobacteria)]|uniref:Na+/H+ antiporter subunit G n=1 Tax=Paracoccus sp. TaxID=267 RepID=UPI0026DF4DAC|nr:Na+/H+ antiporter subunit G [Paracoccus sp. (in: a-proteobacteria)]MDO5632076.1 Na+/H+ antiporter subunit G [Paracoccus sp. (in: a-proteobacteria)]